MNPTQKYDIDEADLRDLRHTLHANPELGLEEVETSNLVAGRLESYGYKVHRGLATTGVVGSMKLGDSARSVGLRADMDALPIRETTGAPYASRNPGLMHACGHDGHTTMLLGAAKVLAERKNFDGTLHLIFQPAEENFGGGKLMIEDGLFDLFPCDAVYGLHNAPELPLGVVGVRDGVMMAACDEVKIILRAPGGHAAHPETTSDPIVAASSMVLALQTIVARNVSANRQAVLTVGRIHGGTAGNIIPSEVELSVDIRTFDPEVRKLMEQRLRELVENQARSFGVEAEITFTPSYGAVVNHLEETDFVRQCAKSFLGADQVIEIPEAVMGAEDFSYMLNECPGSYFVLGISGEKRVMPLHHPAYDFNDEALPIAAAI